MTSSGGQVALLFRVARAPGLRRVQLSFAAFAFSESATWLALLVYALQRGGPREVGIVAVVQLLPAIVIAPFAGYAGDRFRPERALAAGYATQAIAMAATAGAMLAGWSMVAYAAAACAATCMTFTRPVMGSLLPTITHTPRDLVAANVLAGFIEQIGMFAGPLAAGVLLAVWSPTAVFAVGAVIIGAAFVSVLFIDPVEDAADRPTGVDAGGVVSEVLAGFSALRANPRLRALIVLGASAGLLGGVGDVIFVTFADARLDGGSSQAGWLAAAYGVGAIFGAAGTSRLMRSAEVQSQYVFAAVVSCASLAALAAVTHLTPALLAFAVIGMGETMLRLTSSVTLQRHAPSDLLARMFGILESLGTATIALGSLAITVMVASTTLGRSLVILAGVLVAFMLFSVHRLRRLGVDTPLADEAVVDHLIADPLFAPLSAPTIERLARSAERLIVPAGDIIVAQGDVGDLYYLVIDGAAEVTVDGVRIDRLAPGRSFGEIALVRDIPRTATVTALTDLQLLTVPRTTFLEAVTGHPRSRRIADVTVERHLRYRAPADDERAPATEPPIL
jgi:MFS family permease